MSLQDNSHWAAVNRVLAYIKGTLDFGLEYQPDNSPLAGFEAYSDSDWGACPLTSRSTTGYTFVLASGAVPWSSKLQPRVTASSTEAEYLGLSHASKEAIHLSQLLSELAQGSAKRIELFGDNQGANALSRDPQSHNRTRHLCLTEHFVREQVQQGDITVTYILTTRMVADVTTKSLPLPGLRPAPRCHGHLTALSEGVLLQTLSLPEENSPDSSLSLPGEQVCSLPRTLFSLSCHTH